jgi:prevent-host-death family protein
MNAKPERTVKVAELKAKLSEFLRAARAGHAVTVCDRDTPIARLVPYLPQVEPLGVRRAMRALHSIALPKPVGRRIDSLAALLDERQSSR